MDKTLFTQEPSKNQPHSCSALVIDKVFCLKFVAGIGHKQSGTALLGEQSEHRDGQRLHFCDDREIRIKKMLSFQLGDSVRWELDSRRLAEWFLSPEAMAVGFRNRKQEAERDD